MVTLCLSPVCSESTTLSTSAVLRPVLAGYERIKRMVFFGSMTKTLRIVKAIPFSSTFVASWWSILLRSACAPLGLCGLAEPHMSYSSAICLCLSPMIGKLNLLPEISSMSLIHCPCLSIVFALSPMSFTPLFANSGSSFANAPSSVVQLYKVNTSYACR